jgi:hypothetical protein
MVKNTLFILKDKVFSKQTHFLAHFISPEPIIPLHPDKKLFIM